ncbi:MAG: CU044_2847 family protein [Spirulinaceae cyanobacterium]
MELDSQIIPVELSNGTKINVEVTPIGDQQVAFETLPFKQVNKAIEAITQELAQTINKVRPSKASVKFGLEISLESGQLTTMLVKGSGKANLEITLEWGQST